MDEIAVGDVGGSVGAENIGDVNRKSREVETAGEEAGDRHDDIVDKGFHDGGEGATDGDTDRKVDDATAIDEFFELADKLTIGDFLDGVGFG